MVENVNINLFLQVCVIVLGMREVSLKLSRLGIILDWINSWTQFNIWRLDPYYYKFHEHCDM